MMSEENANKGISRSQTIPSNEVVGTHTEKPRGTPLSQAAVARPSAGWRQPPSLCTPGIPGIS
jgi:hypothetical protein